MGHLTKTLIASLILCSMSRAAHAADLSDCEVLLVQVLQVEDAEGTAQIASYRPAEGFLRSLKDDLPGHMTQIDGQNIQALMCHRNEVIPAQSDYAVMSTGIPFILSQDFDSADTDSLTMYWKDGKIEHVYNGYPLSKEIQAILDARLAEFSERGLSASAHEAAAVAAKIKAKNELTKNNELAKTSTIAPEIEDVIVTNSRAHDGTDTQTLTESEAKRELIDATARAVEIEDPALTYSKIPNATQLNIQTEIEIEE